MERTGHQSIPLSRVVQERLRRCHYCGEHLNKESELYLLADAVYCCQSHRALAAAADNCAGTSDPGSPIKVPVSTGVGLAASHRSWLSLDDLDSCPSSRESTPVNSPKRRPRHQQGGTVAHPQREQLSPAKRSFLA